MLHAGSCSINDFNILLLSSTFLMIIFQVVYLPRGHSVLQFVEALRYKPDGHGFDSRWCHWNFSLT